MVLELEVHFGKFMKLFCLLLVLDSSLSHLLFIDISIPLKYSVLQPKDSSLTLIHLCYLFLKINAILNAIQRMELALKFKPHS